MSSKLTKDREAFRKAQKTWAKTMPASATTSNTYSPAVTPPGTPGGSTPSPKKKVVEKKTGVVPPPNGVWSQPADKGPGSDPRTQLFLAVDYLKKQGVPMRLEDIITSTRAPLDSSAELLAKFKSHEKVVYDPKSGLFSYRPEYDQINSRNTLISSIKKTTRRGGGMSVRTLKDGWSGAGAAIDELEKEGMVLVTRTNKDNLPKFVFWNDIQEHEGGKRVEQEFLDLWDNLKVPPEADLLRELAQEGLQAAESIAVKAKNGGVTKKRTKKAGTSRNHNSKVTNTHLNADLTVGK